MKVKATELGYYEDKRRRPGDVFEISDEKAFSHKWMEKLDDSVEVPSPPPAKEAKKSSKKVKSSEEVI